MAGLEGRHKDPAVRLDLYRHRAIRLKWRLQGLWPPCGSWASTGLTTSSTQVVIDVCRRLRDGRGEGRGCRSVPARPKAGDLGPVFKILVLCAEPLFLLGI